MKKQKQNGHESTWLVAIPSDALFSVLSFCEAKFSLIDFPILSKACRGGKDEALHGKHRELLRIHHSSVEAVARNKFENDEDEFKCKSLLLQLVSSRLSTDVVPPLMYGTLEAEHRPPILQVLRVQNKTIINGGMAYFTRVIMSDGSSYLQCLLSVDCTIRLRSGGVNLSIGDQTTLVSIGRYLTSRFRYNNIPVVIIEQMDVLHTNVSRRVGYPTWFDRPPGRIPDPFIDDL